MGTRHAGPLVAVFSPSLTAQKDPVLQGHAGPLVAIFLRQVLLDRLGRDLVGQGADRELVLAEEVGIIGGSQVGGEFADLAVDGFMNGPGQILISACFSGDRGVDAMVASSADGASPQNSQPSPLCTKIPPTFKTPTVFANSVTPLRCFTTTRYFVGMGRRTVFRDADCLLPQA